MKPLTAATLVLICGCSFGPDLPELPEREQLPLNIAVDPAYDAILADSNDPNANGRLGMVLHRLGRHADAELLYRRAHLLDRDSFQWIYLLGIVQTYQADYNAALASLNAALSRKPDCLPARIRISELYLRTEDFLNGKELLADLTANQHSAPIAYYHLGKIQVQQGEIEAATESFSRACELYPAYGSAHYALGLVYVQQNNSTEARRHFILADKHMFNEPLVDDPLLKEVIGEDFLPAGLLTSSLTLEADGKLNEALEACRMALSMDSRNVEIHARMVKLLAEANQPNKAVSHFHLAVEIDPDYTASYLNLGLLRLSQQRFQEARELFDKMLSINPYSAEALTELGLLLEQDGHDRIAEDHYRRAIKYRPEYRPARMRLGRLLMRLHQPSKAANEFEAAVQVTDSKTPGYLYEIGRQYLLEGDRQTAADYIGKARSLAVKMGQAKLLDTIDNDLRKFR